MDFIFVINEIIQPIFCGTTCKHNTIQMINNHKIYTENHDVRGAKIIH